mmetsp:Transcript_13326/g.21095  ORF Transcript_13326/g.21095 Transcript_13326/m.21095 type:complete len:233 (-) Transcript_13326:1196-1894(-)
MRRQRQIHHIVLRASFLRHPGTRPQRVLMAADKQAARLVPQQGLRAVAMVHIKIYHSHTAQSVTFQRMFGRNCCCAKQTKSHRFVLLRMMPRRTTSHKSIAHLTRHHRVHSRQTPANRVACGQGRARRHIGVAIQSHRTTGRFRRCDGLQMALRMAQQDIRIRTLRRVSPIQSIKLRRLQRRLNMLDPCNLLRVPRRCLVVQRTLMTEQRCGHATPPSLLCRACCFARSIRR